MFCVFRAVPCVIYYCGLDNIRIVKYRSSTSTQIAGSPPACPRCPVLSGRRYCPFEVAVVVALAVALAVALHPNRTGDADMRLPAACAMSKSSRQGDSKIAPLRTSVSVRTNTHAHSSGVPAA